MFKSYVPALSPAILKAGESWAKGVHCHMGLSGTRRAGGLWNQMSQFLKGKGTVGSRRARCLLWNARALGKGYPKRMGIEEPVLTHTQPWRR